MKEWMENLLWGILRFFLKIVIPLGICALSLFTGYKLIPLLPDKQSAVTAASIIIGLVGLGSLIGIALLNDIDDWSVKEYLLYYLLVFLGAPVMLIIIFLSFPTVAADASNVATGGASLHDYERTSTRSANAKANPNTHPLDAARYEAEKDKEFAKIVAGGCGSEVRNNYNEYCRLRTELANYEGDKNSDRRNTERIRGEVDMAKARLAESIMREMKGRNP